jgi:hypothetical protein
MVGQSTILISIWPQLVWQNPKIGNSDYEPLYSIRDGLNRIINVNSHLEFFITNNMSPT